MVYHIFNERSAVRLRSRIALTGLSTKRETRADFGSFNKSRIVAASGAAAEERD